LFTLKLRIQSYQGFRPLCAIAYTYYLIHTLIEEEESKMKIISLWSYDLL